jgi:hypothetical protein
MRSILLMAALAASASTLTTAHAVELKPYDRFVADKPIDQTRWFESERVRELKGGAMRLMQRTWGVGDANSGISSASWSSSLTQPASVTDLRARVTVTGIEANACPTNTSAVTDARARIVGSFFNVGSPTPGSMFGDAIAQVRLLRTSNSTDPEGVLQVQGILSVCTNPDCAFAMTVGNVVDLGTVTVGTPTTVRMRWDQPGKTFHFERDAGKYRGTVAYSESDSNPASATFRQLSTRVNVQACLTAPRVSAMVDARFDNVAVNPSALP